MSDICGAGGLGGVTCQLHEHSVNVMHHARGRDAHGSWVLEWYDPDRLRALLAREAEEAEPAPES